MIYAFWMLLLCGGWGMYALLRSMDGPGQERDTLLAGILGTLLCAVLLATLLNWSLALALAFNARALMIGALVLGAGGALALFRVGLPARPRLAGEWSIPGVYYALVPLGLAILYGIAKAWVLPTANVDALTVHVPRAILLVRDHGLNLLAAPPPALRVHFAQPINYELLTADTIALTGSDGITEWVGLFGYVGLLIASARLFELGWGRGTHLLAGVLAVAATPIALLHMAADKMDLLVCLMLMGAMLHLAGWITARRGSDSILFILSLAWMCGAKKSGGLFSAALLPFWIWPAFREAPQRRAMLKHLAWGAAAALPLGCAIFIYNRLHTSHVFGTTLSIASSTRNGEFFHLANLIQYPWMLLTAPYSSNPSAVWAPWAGEYWFWPWNNIVYSHYGKLFGLMVVGLAFTWVARRRGWLPAPGQALGWVSWMSLACTVLLVSKNYGLLGGYNTFPRFTLYGVPVLAAWTLVPWSLRWGPKAGTWLMSAYFSAMAITYAQGDLQTPFSYFERLLDDASLRREVWWNPGRTPCIVDRMAGPEDGIAVEVQRSTWLQPLFGPGLRRPVFFILPDKDGFHIPDQALWVVADNISGSAWNFERDSKTMGDRYRLQGQGHPAPQEMALYNQLLKDPHFRLVAKNEFGNQCIFRRTP